TDTQLRDLIARIERETNSYKRQMSYYTSRSSDSALINSYVSDFENATNRLRDRFNSRQSTNADASEVLARARIIDQFMARNRINSTAETQWSSLRSDLSTLANYYNMAWNWNEQIGPYPSDNFPGSRVMDARMTGTYRLNTRRSDNVATA